MWKLKQTKASADLIRFRFKMRDSEGIRKTMKERIRETDEF